MDGCVEELMTERLMMQHVQYKLKLRGRGGMGVLDETELTPRTWTSSTEHYLLLYIIF